MTWALPLAFGVAAVIGSAAVGGVRWNGTQSMPCGLWLVRSLPSQLHRGDIVAACVKPSAAVRAYVGKGECQDTGLEPVVKEVAAVAGDTVAVTEAGVVVNDALVPHSARLHVDGQGRSWMCCSRCQRPQSCRLASCGWWHRRIRASTADTSARSR
jgi:conjugative transfer signal peptidase TraF